MSVKTQGTELYAIDPRDDSLIDVGCVQSISGITTPVETIETTCLADAARTFIAGLQSPGAAGFELNTDPSDTTHEALHQLKELGSTIKWAVGWSNATTDPSVDSSGEWDLTSATDRHWLTFEGFQTDFPFDFNQNDVVKSAVAVQISGAVTLTKATT